MDEGNNGMWVLLTGMGILFMQAGFMMLELGASKAKSVRAVMFKNLLDHSVDAIAWYCVGFSLMIGGTSGSTTTGFASGSDVEWFSFDVQLYARLFQSFGFCVTCCTLVSGAVLERLKLEVYLLFSALMSAVIYPIAAHWIWAPHGWLTELGFRDFSGSCAVHVLGAACALVAAACCGPRVGRFAMDVPSTPAAAAADVAATSAASANSSMTISTWTRQRVARRVREQKGYSPNSQVLGAMLLYVAWFSFNCGAGGGVSESGGFMLAPASRAAVNTLVASASGNVAGFLWNKAFRKQAYDLELNVHCMLGSLVAVTGPCAFIHPWAAIVLGVLSVPVYVGSSNLVLHVLHVDDALRVVSVHGACGVLGTLWLGLADMDRGAFYGHGGRQFGVQLLGCVSVAAWGMALSAIFFYGLRFALPKLARWRFSSDMDENTPAVAEFIPSSLCYSRDEQLAGIDFFHFGGNVAVEMDIEAVAEYNTTQRIKSKYERKLGCGSNTPYSQQQLLRMASEEAAIARPASAMGVDRHPSPSPPPRSDLDVA